MGFIKKHLYIILSFVISFIVMTLAFAYMSVFPFGSNQIMIIDSWHQYYPFLQELHHKLTHGESILYSWNIGLGSNFLLIMAYYAMSPLYLLSVLFPKEYLREFMLLATILKISFASTFFSIYLKHHFKRNDLSILFFGLFYGFSSYAMGYYWNIMWLDSMAILPLIILGVHKVLEEDRFYLYVITLALAIISNFYIGYQICLFILVYFFVLYFIKYTDKKKNHFFDKIIMMAIYTAMSFGIAAFIILPTINGLKLSYSLSTSNPKEFKTYFSIIDIISNLLPGIDVSTRSGLPNIYCGLLSLILLLLFFFSTSITIRTKILNFFMLMFLLLSFNINYIDFVWHGFSFPNEVPFRFAFVFSFLILTLAYEAYIHFEDYTKKMLWGVVIGLFAYLLACEKIYKETFDKNTIYIGLLFLVLYGAALLLFKYQKLSKNIFAGLICLIVLGEVLINAINGTETSGNSDRKSYPPQNTQIQSILKEIRAENEEFHRLEFITWYSTNDPALYDYNGVSKFASTSNSHVSVFAQKLGLAAAPESNRYLYSSSTPIINALFSVKYLLGRENGGYMPNAAFELVKEQEGVNVFKNKYYLPLGYVVDSSIIEWELSKRNPFTNQEAFISSATSIDQKVFDGVSFTNESYVNMDLTNKDGLRRYYKNNNSSSVGSAKITYTAPKTGQMYVYMFANQTHEIEIKLKGNVKKYNTRIGQIIDLGILEEGTNFDVTFEVSAAKDGFFDLQVVTFDEERFIPIYNELADEVLQVTEYTDTKIKGTVNALHDGSLYLSIPYENGWKAKIDGKEVKIVPIKDAMMTLPITSGSHTVELTYCPEGLVLGIIVTVFTILFLGVMFFLSKKKK